MDNFGRDPWAKNAMIQTAENVCKESGVTREECDAVALRRYEQYTDALADDRAFQKGYMFPAEVQVSRKKTALVEADEGVMPTTAEGLAKLRPVMPEGAHTFGSQTHPADGNCGLVVTTREKASELSGGDGPEIQIVSYGHSRAKKGYMAMAVVPAAQMALEKAGIAISDTAAIKTHNPFAANDVYMAKTDGHRRQRLQQLRLLHDFRPPPGPHGRTLHHRRHRGSGRQGRRLPAMGRMRRRRHGRGAGVEDWLNGGRICGKLEDG